MLSFDQWINEDKKGSISVEGKDLKSKYITISNVPEIINNELNAFDKETFGMVITAKDKLEWDAYIDYTANVVHIDFTNDCTEVKIDGELYHNVHYKGIITINPMTAELKSKIEYTTSEK